ncbi:hypothetical protein DFH08DRAFT_827122 [Mycena albidolilacea]|uniref:Uncharacterized protein n=1 Tax=Mycena albidolilacea TaxID=1033008 RepID=A0AAD7E7N8_9AGAR|nr:hypothetical protein DFH08DRAFT_827122 [Mycena albidolilacea]
MWSCHKLIGKSASLLQLHAYREQAYVNHPFFQVDRADDWVAPALFIARMRLMRGEAYVNHPFFQVDRAEDWVAPAPFNAWMWLMWELEEERGCKVDRSELAQRQAQSVVTLLVRLLLSALLTLAPCCCYSTGSGFSSRAASLDADAIHSFDLDIPPMILHVESPPATPETAAILQETAMSKISRCRGKGKGKPVEEDPIPTLKSLMSSTSTASSQSPS